MVSHLKNSVLSVPRANRVGTCENFRRIYYVYSSINCLVVFLKMILIGCTVHTDPLNSIDKELGIKFIFQYLGGGGQRWGSEIFSTHFEDNEPKFH